MNLVKMREASAHNHLVWVHHKAHFLLF